MRKIRAGGSPGRSFLILAGPDAAVCTTATLEHGLSHGTQGSVRLRAPRSGAQTVVTQRVWGGVGKALLRHRGNKTLHRRLGESAPRQDGDDGSTPTIHGGRTGLPTNQPEELSVVEPAGKEVSGIEKNRDVRKLQFETPTHNPTQAYPAVLYQDRQPPSESSPSYAYTRSGRHWIRLYGSLNPCAVKYDGCTKLQQAVAP